MTIIIGIDPGSRVTGYGVIATQAQSCEYLTSGCVRLVSDSLPQRLHQLFMGLQEIIHCYQPTVAAIEQVFFHQNPSTAIKLGQARGVALVALAHGGIEAISEYSPRAIKKAIVGYGAAEKAQIQQMVKTLLCLSAEPQEDAADALAVALCHAYNQRYDHALSAASAKTKDTII